MDLILDCRDGISAIHDRISETLNLPHWYGRNLDALHDCLTATTADLRITLVEPSLFPALLRVLQDCAEENPHIQLLDIE